MNYENKKTIAEAIEVEITRLGSANKVAAKCGVSSAVISQMRTVSYETENDTKWNEVAKTLGVVFSETWKIAETSSLRMIFQVFSDAKEKSMFIAVSHRAGGGKTASAKLYAGRSNKVFYLQCREWSRQKFVFALAQVCGIDTTRRSVTAIDELMTDICAFFNQQSASKPLLLIDEADKLKPTALRTFITLYNECEGSLGCVILGTDNLSKDIESGVRKSHKGFDEIHSRFGRKFVVLVGATKSDVEKICTANGVGDKAKIAQIWTDSEPKNKQIGNNRIEVIEDLRRLRRIVERETLKGNG